jgi:hypothetical protein
MMPMCGRRPVSALASGTNRWLIFEEDQPSHLGRAPVLAVQRNWCQMLDHRWLRARSFTWPNQPTNPGYSPSAAPGRRTAGWPPGRNCARWTAGNAPNCWPAPGSWRGWHRSRNSRHRRRHAHPGGPATCVARTRERHLLSRGDRERLATDLWAQIRGEVRVDPVRGQPTPPTVPTIGGAAGNPDLVPARRSHPARGRPRRHDQNGSRWFQSPTAGI